VYSVQGSTTRLGRAIAQSGSYPNKNHKGKVIRHGYCAWNVGTEHCKDFIFGNLAADGERVPDDRVFHFPQGLDDSYYDGVLSETYDPEHKRYVQRLGARYKRNEPLDTLVYAWAIGQHREINIGRGRAGRPDPKYWERLAVMLEPADRVVVAGKLVDASVQISVPEPLQQFQQLHDSGFGKDGWGL
jgi:phage terminase large subunit GpA-like protein